MIKMNMLSNTFAHQITSTWHKVSDKVKWSFNSYENDISVYCDMQGIKRAYNDRNDGKIKILWLLESKSFDQGAYDFILKNINIIDLFVEVWTHNDVLLEISDKFKRIPAFATVIDKCEVPNKSKNISMITSNKTWCDGHRKRYEFALKNKNHYDLYGKGINEINKKEDALLDYRFSVAIENNVYDTYFTEKILDCFATKTIPIYIGTKKVTNYFNGDGIVFIDYNFNDWEIFNGEFYESRINAIEENYTKVWDEYNIWEDWIYDNHLQKFLK
jgi:hypothetical protein